MNERFSCLSKEFSKALVLLASYLPVPIPIEEE
jgi:hypothetical protein